MQLFFYSWATASTALWKKNVLRIFTSFIKIWPTCTFKSLQLYQMSGYLAVKKTHMICTICTLFIRRVRHKHMMYDQTLTIRQMCAIKNRMICMKCTLRGKYLSWVVKPLFPFWLTKDSHEWHSTCEQNYPFLCRRSNV